MRYNSGMIIPEIEELIAQIRNNRTHGATELARQALQIMKAASEHSLAENTESFLSEMKAIGDSLVATHPAMAPIYNSVTRLLDSLPKEKTPDSLKQFAVSKAAEMIAASERAVEAIAEYGANLISDGDVILTHSYSSTVIEVLKKAAAWHKIEVIVTRSGAGRTGERTARELGSAGIPLTFIDDTATGIYAQVASKVMVGADRICADGGVVNGVGTYPLAVVAGKNLIPFYILCDTLKLDPRVKSGEVDLEEKEAIEVVEAGKLPLDVVVKNPYFDITPLELVTAIITEEGMLTPEAVMERVRGS